MLDALERFASHLVLAHGWRRRGLAFLFGALSALAQAPFHLAPILFVTLPALLFLIEGAVETARSGRVRRLMPAFWTGWWFGFGYFLAGLWWIGSAFLVDAERFAWLMPAAVLAMPVGLALFYGLAMVIARLLWRDGWRRIIALAVGLAAAEWLRGHVLTGFPWNQIGYALAAEPVGMQTAALVGGYGLSFLSVLLFAAPAAVIAAEGVALRAGRRYAAFAVLLAVAIAGFGIWRLQANPTAFVPDVKLRIVQPAQDEMLKWQSEATSKVIPRLLKLSDRPTSPERSGLADVTHLIWPESPFPYLLAREPGALAEIAAALPANVTLITGANRLEPPSAGEKAPHYYNTLYVIGDDGHIEAAYDKAHLVPFGEYIPFFDLLKSWGIDNVGGLAGGFEPGPGLRTLPVRGAPGFAPLICYEIIFPGAVIGENERPGWIVNVTNDGWFGNTPGPRQHFHQVQIRAVEEGIPVVRAANTGISAIVDPVGRVVARLDIDIIGILDGALPAAIASPLYARLGDWLLLSLLLSGFLLNVAIRGNYIERG
ncbi:MAG: apolipoprotein N-acyltransferase [Hyphomicrobiaceae bacterium]|nr:apolipoprotein N-acyltransferase [Hyphomicrobiaceae bacterium]